MAKFKAGDEAVVKITAVIYDENTDSYFYELEGTEAQVKESVLVRLKAV